MRFIVMHKVDALMESGGPPNQDIVQGMGQLIGESRQNGVFENGAGLHRSARRVRLGFERGERSMKEGPYAGQNELVASVAMIKAASMAAAIEHAGRYAEVLGDVEIEIGPVVEAWDLGFMPKPAKLENERFLLLVKGDAATERGAPDPKRAAALSALEKHLSDEGTLLLTERLTESSRGARLAAGPKGKRTWVDGPFAESKELIAGFSILQVPDKAAAIEWANRYGAILDGNEVDVRELA